MRTQNRPFSPPKHYLQTCSEAINQPVTQDYIREKVDKTIITGNPPKRIPKPSWPAAGSWSDGSERPS
ncbi:MAG: hypothetical protein J5I98_10855 [Phaeodactylibacter sp.]|nr:hypothetical protein [Phaeodactylibacter sp.]